MENALVMVGHDALLLVERELQRDPRVTSSNSRRAYRGDLARGEAADQVAGGGLRRRAAGNEILALYYLGEDALLVNWCNLSVVHEETGEQLCHNSFSTNHLFTNSAIKPVAQVGRARWKVEMDFMLDGLELSHPS